MEQIDHYIVLDFEATCSEKTKQSPQEIIEFPSVVVDSKTLDPVNQIQLYIRPVHHPTLTKFCTNLTGITQETINSANTFRGVYNYYDKWLQKYPNSIFVTCGDWDLKSMLPRQARTSNIRLPWYYGRWINIKTEFDAFYPNKHANGLSSMLKVLDMEFVGRPHSGLDDCINIARLWKKMAEDGYKPSDASIRW